MKHISISIFIFQWNHLAKIPSLGSTSVPVTLKGDGLKRGSLSKCLVGVLKFKKSYRGQILPSPLMSLWMIIFWCRYATPSSICLVYFLIWPSVIGPSLCSRSWIDPWNRETEFVKLDESTHVRLPKENTAQGQKAFSFRRAKICNSLPSDAKFVKLRWINSC